MTFLQKHLPKKLKTRLIAALGLLIVLVLGAGMPAANYFARENFYSVQQKPLTNTLEIINSELITLPLEKLKLLSHTMALLTPVQWDMQRKDREHLLEFTMPIYKKLQSELDINVFHFHLPPAISFLRLQKPQKFGDDLSSFRHTVNFVNQQKLDASGLEVGKAGISIRSVSPVFNQSRHVGSVEFGAPINNALALRVKAKTGYDISVLIPDGAGFKYQAKTHNLTIPDKQIPFLKRIMSAKKTVIKKNEINNRKLLTAYMPLEDYSGNPVGILAVPYDVTTGLNDLKEQIFYFFLAATAGLVGAQVLLFAVFRFFIDKPLAQIQNILEKAGKSGAQPTCCP